MNNQHLSIEEFQVITEKNGLGTIVHKTSIIGDAYYDELYVRSEGSIRFLARRPRRAKCTDLLYRISPEFEHLLPKKDDICPGSFVMIRDRCSTPGQYAKGQVIARSRRGPEWVIVEWTENDQTVKVGDVSVMALAELYLV